MRLQPMGIDGDESVVPLWGGLCARDIKSAVARVVGRFVHQYLPSCISPLRVSSLSLVSGRSHRYIRLSVLIIIAT